MRNFFKPNSLTTGVFTLMLLLHLPLSAGDLIGRVSDATGMNHLSGAEVEVINTDRRAVTKSNGEYRIAGLAEGKYTVSVSYVGAETLQQTVLVEAQGQARLDARMQAVSGNIDEVVVVGQRGSQASALSKQRSSDTISSFVSKDAIGQFPDQNVSEAVRRVSGVSVQNDQGEGRFIVLRGLDPNLNAASLNGVRVTSPESDIRAVALDVVAAELVETIEIQKSLIPEMDGDSIGGAINIRTTSALDRDGTFFSLTGGTSYNELTDNWSPKIGLDGSTILNDRLGVSLGFSYFDRALGSENVEADSWTDDSGVVYAEDVEFRDYDVTRTRIGATVGLDYLLTEDTTLFARGVYNSFEDQEQRSRVSMDFGDAAPITGDDDSASFSLGSGEEIGVERDIKDRSETQEIISLVFGGKTYHDRWTFDYTASFTHSEEDESDSFDPTVFARTFEEGELALTQSALRGDIPQISVDSASNALFSDPAEYEFDELEHVNGLAEDDEWGLKLDIARDFDLASGQAQLKVGGRGRFREKRYALSLDLYDGYNGTGDFLLDTVQNTVDYPLSSINPVPGAGEVRSFLANLADFELNTAESEFESNAADFRVDEDIYAAYLQGRYEQGPWRVIGGVRMERTENDIRGNRVDFAEEDATFNGVTLTEDTTFVTPVSFEKEYTNWLPSLSVRFEARDDLIARGGVYRSVVRPNIQDIAPRFVIEQDDGDAREGELGNPDLNELRAWNIDFGLEWYFADNAVLQGGVFYKDIDDFIVSTIVQDTTFNGIFLDEAVIPFNGESADVLGFELNYQQALTGLPAPFDGLLLGLNYTYVDSEGTFGTRKIALPGTSENVFNMVLGYEKGPFSVRLAGSYRDEYLDELSDDGSNDRFVKDFFSLDISAKYQFMDNAQLYLEAVNLTDEPFVAVARTTDYGDRLLQYEEYSFTLNAGIRMTF